MFTALDKRETPSRRPERRSKGTFSKKQLEIGCLENDAKSTKSMDYSPWFKVDFGTFYTFRKSFITEFK